MISGRSSMGVDRKPSNGILLPPTVRRMRWFSDFSAHIVDTKCLYVMLERFEGSI